MNKHLVALCAMATLAAPALAQNGGKGDSSVTAYGVADVALVRNSNLNGVQLRSMNSGSLQSSRVGFRGREDLGDGLSAMFVLEHGLNLDAGTPTSATVFWNRQAFVGLSSRQWGTVTAGFQYTPIYDHLILMSGAPTFGVAGGAVDGIALPGSSAGRFNNTIGGTRYANSVKYTSPTVSGFKANAMVALGEVAGASSAGNLSSVGVGYSQGPIKGVVSYLSINCPAVTGCTATQDTDKVLAVGAEYGFQSATVAAIFTNEKNGKNVRGNEADVFSILVSVPVNAWILAAGFQKMNDKTTANQDLRQFNLSAIYFLSKRTSLYGFWADQDVENGGKASMGVTNSSDGKQNQVGLGIRHLF